MDLKKLFTRVIVLGVILVIVGYSWSNKINQKINGPRYVSQDLFAMAQRGWRKDKKTPDTISLVGVGAILFGAFMRASVKKNKPSA